MTQRSLQQVPLSDSSELRLTVAAPESAVRGGILVVPEAYGVTDAVWQLAEGLAGEGWLAVIGLGGAVALIVAAQRDLGAAVTVDGIGVMQPVVPTLPALVEAAPELHCPWLGLYGPDSEIPDPEVHKLRDAAHSAQVATDLVHYCLDTDQSTVEETWARTLNWFDCHLR
jgi:carboxymethylenebutenolidase